MPRTRTTRAGQMKTATIPNGRNNNRDDAAALTAPGAVVVICTSPGIVEAVRAYDHPARKHTVRAMIQQHSRATNKSSTLAETCWSASPQSELRLPDTLDVATLPRLRTIDVRVTNQSASASRCLSASNSSLTPVG